MFTDPGKSIADRKALKEQYGALFNRISSALFEADPIGINFESNTDEYDPEAGTIIPRLKGAASVHDVEVIIHEEFCRWFSSEDAGPIEKYSAVASEVWEVWCEFKKLHASTPR
ncbi:hypothetical protein [Methylobacter sp.]|uniref:hypothetical protein n=1 Tax=Methylobacter sp. TaxID=2051955 RepID=UPI00120BE7B1|nr:hypothetical protein [Methylobacter sp.]TAK61701.1 MAG: hypothetical protein EPO18_12935 [Methylobacter sp.]